MQGDIIALGVELMLHGMGTVVVFLALLVLVTTLMSSFITRHLPEEESCAAAALQKLRAEA